MNSKIKTLVITMVLVMVVGILATSSFADDKKLSLKSESAFAMSASTGEVIYEMNPDKRVNPASITKLLTAMVLIDNIKSDDEYNNQIEVEIICDEKDLILSVEDLLYLMLRVSSNDAADELAKYSKGSKEEFVSAMNSKAAEMGLSNTNFMTPSGVYIEGQYSTAKDVSKWTYEALKYPLIKDALSNSKHEIKSMGIDLESEKELLVGGDKVEINGKMRSPKYEGVYSVKSGTGHKENMSSLIAGVIDDDMDIIVVVLCGSKESYVQDTVKLLDYSIENVTRNPLIEDNEKVDEIRVKHGAVTKVDVVAAKKGYVYQLEGTSEKLTRKVPVLNKELIAPVKKGTVVGRYEMYLEDELVGEVDLIVNQDIKVGWFPSYFYISNSVSIIIAIALYLLLIATIITLGIINRKRKRREEINNLNVKELAKVNVEMQEDQREKVDLP